MFPLAADTTPWRKLAIEGVRTITVEGKTVLRISPDALSDLAGAFGIVAGDPG
jgi:fumarate hydratase class I